VGVEEKLGPGVGLAVGLGVELRVGVEEKLGPGVGLAVGLGVELMVGFGVEVWVGFGVGFGVTFTSQGTILSLQPKKEPKAKFRAPKPVDLSNASVTYILCRR